MTEHSSYNAPLKANYLMFGDVPPDMAGEGGAKKAKAGDNMNVREEEDGIYFDAAGGGSVYVRDVVHVLDSIDSSPPNDTVYIFDKNNPGSPDCRVMLNLLAPINGIKLEFVDNQPQGAIWVEDAQGRKFRENKQDLDRLDISMLASIIYDEATDKWVVCG